MVQRRAADMRPTMEEQSWKPGSTRSPTASTGSRPSCRISRRRPASPSTSSSSWATSRCCSTPGLRKMFPLVRDGGQPLIPPERLRWIAFGHYEADECGAMNEWLAVAPQAAGGARPDRLPGLAERHGRPRAAHAAGRRNDRPRRRQAGPLPRHAAHPAWLGRRRALRGIDRDACCAATCSPSSATGRR